MREQARQQSDCRMVQCRALPPVLPVARLGTCANHGIHQIAARRAPHGRWRRRVVATLLRRRQERGQSAVAATAAVMAKGKQQGRQRNRRKAERGERLNVGKAKQAHALAEAVEAASELQYPPQPVLPESEGQAHSSSWSVQSSITPHCPARSAEQHAQRVRAQ